MKIWNWVIRIHFYRVSLRDIFEFFKKKNSNKETYLNFSKKFKDLDIWISWGSLGIANEQIDVSLKKRQLKLSET